MIGVGHQHALQIGAHALRRNFCAHAPSGRRGQYFRFSQLRSSCHAPELPRPLLHSSGLRECRCSPTSCNQWGPCGFLLSLTTPPTTTLLSGSDVALIAAADNDGCSLPEAQALLSALAEPNRLEILRLVWRRELPAGQIAARFHLTRTAVSGHLRVMERAGLLARPRQGSLRPYPARPERIAALLSFLAALRWMG